MLTTHSAMNEERAVQLHV